MFWFVPKEGSGFEDFDSDTETIRVSDVAFLCMLKLQITWFTLHDTN